MTHKPDVTQEMVLLYDEYTHVTLDRRRFMDRLTKLAGSTAAAAAIVPLLEANAARAAIVAADDARLATRTVAIPGGQDGLSGYLAIPANASGKLPGIVVIHENRGLNPHIQDVARRAALEGFVALAPDFLSPAGGTPADEDAAREMIRALDGPATVNDAVAAAAFLDGHAATTGKIGAVGFCWGGAMANQLAVHSDRVDAVVAFYGRQPDAADVPRIRAQLMLHYAGLDDRINKGIADYEAALKAAGVAYTLYMYDNVNHAFHNDTSETRYDEAAARLAWSRTIAFFKETLA